MLKNGKYRIKMLVLVQIITKIAKNHYFKNNDFF